MSRFEEFLLCGLCVYAAVAPYVTARLALWLCSRDWGCVARRQGKLDKWHAQLESERPTS